MAFVKVITGYGAEGDAAGTYELNGGTGIFEQITPNNGYFFEFEASVWSLFVSDVIGVFLSSSPAIVVGVGGDISTPATASWLSYEVTDYLIPGEITATPSSPSSPGQLPSTIGGAVVTTSPGSIDPQAAGIPTSPGAVSPQAPGVPDVPENYLSTAYLQDLSQVQRDQLAENWPEAIAGANYWEGSLPQTLKKLSNPPLVSYPRSSRLDVMISGDSLSAIGPSRQLITLMQSQFGIGGYGLGMLDATLTAGATTGDDHTIWANGTYWTIPVSGVVTLGADSSSSYGTELVSVHSDTVKVFYQTEAATTIDVETSDDEGATWTSAGTVDCSTGNAATFSVTEGHNLLRLTGATGTAIVYGAELSVDATNSLNKAVVIHSIARSDTVPSEWVAMPEAAFQAVMAEIKPCVNVMCNNDGVTANEGGTLTLISRIEGAVAAADKSDQLFVSGNPIADPTIRAETGAWMRAYVKAQGLGYAYFDALAFGGDFTTWDALGFNLDGTHPSKAGNKFLAAGILAASSMPEAYHAAQDLERKHLQLQKLMGVDTIDQRGSESGTGGAARSNRGLLIFGKNTDSRLGFDTPGYSGNEGFIRHENGDLSIGTSTNGVMTFYATGRIAINRFNALTANNQPAATGPWFHVENLDTGVAGFRVVMPDATIDQRVTIETYRNDILTFYTTAAGWLVPTTPEYADDAAADADSALPAGAYYRVTSDRTVYRKP